MNGRSNRLTMTHNVIDGAGRVGGHTYKKVRTLYEAVVCAYKGHTVSLSPSLSLLHTYFTKLSLQFCIFNVNMTFMLTSKIRTYKYEY